MTITALPTPPSRADAANFAARGDAFLSALPTFVTEANATASAVNAAAAAAAASATTATTSPNTQATSTSSVAIGLGSKSFTIETGKSIVADMWVAIVSAASGIDWMAGDVASYNSGTGALVVNVQRVSGTSTPSSWAVYATSPMLPDSAPRALVDGSTIKDAGGTDHAIGFLGAPVIPVSAPHTLALVDRGCTLELTSTATITIPPHATLPFTPGDIVLFQNLTGTTKTISPGAGVTLRQAGTTNTGARTLKAWGAAMVRFTGTNDLVIASGDLT